MTDMIDMTKAEVLAIWKEFVKHMTDQGAVFPFANEIASRARNEMLARVEAAEKERDNANAAAVGVALKAEMLEAERDALLNALETLAEHFEYYTLEDARAAIAKATEVKP